MRSEIAHAVGTLRGGGLVAFATETVYGLGADATHAAAVLRIFAAKDRPPTNPLIVHVADASFARKYAGIWSGTAAKLAERFWPGPLTLVVPRSPTIVPEVSAGRDTVALRSPDHPLAQELLRAFNGPIAAPSANRSTRISPTTAEHVRDELGDRVDVILDGGPCRVGIESTVLDLATATPTILRPGSITREQLEAEIGPVEMFAGSVDPSTAASSPGQQAIHYAPNATAYRFAGAQAAEVSRWCQGANPHSHALLLLESPSGSADLLRHSVERSIALPSHPRGYAVGLYAALRELDRPWVRAILVEMPPDRSDWSAIRDRLLRATRDWKDSIRYAGETYPR